MKKVLILLLIKTFLFADDTRVKKINQTLSELQTQLKNQSEENIKVTYDPFYPKIKKVLKKHQKSIYHKQRHYYHRPVVSMILNHKAFIDGKWYNKNQKVAHYMLQEINEDHVVLTKKGKRITLHINNPKEILITKKVH